MHHPTGTSEQLTGALAVERVDKYQIITRRYLSHRLVNLKLSTQYDVLSCSLSRHDVSPSLCIVMTVHSR